jgi:hypothetical protein
MRSLFLAVFAIACASAPRADLASSPRQAVRVEVQNDAAVAATVYVVDHGMRTRVGEASASSLSRFVLQRAPDSPSFYITTPWGTNGSTNEIAGVQSGDRLFVKIDPQIAAPSAWRNLASAQPTP